MKHFLIYILMGVVLMSCSAKKFLPEDARYFAGHEFEYAPEDEQVPKALKNRLENEISPDPVFKVFGSRPEVWLHGVVGETKKEKGFKYFLKYRIGKEPVYVNDISLPRNTGFVENLLVSEGFFRASVQARVDSSKREAKVVYEINQGPAYRYDSLFVCEEPSSICAPVDSLIRTGSLKPGDIFSRTELEEERTRIGDHFRSEGYYYFRQDYVKYSVDSTAGNQTVKVRADIEEGLDAGWLQPYRVVDVLVDISGNSTAKDTLPGPIRVIVGRHNPFLKPDKILPFIALEPGQLYSLEDQRITLRQLNRLDVFEFVNIRFTPDTMLGSYELRAEVLTSPRKKQSLSTELTVSTTSNNFTGPGIRVEYNNRNLFRGAEKLRITGVGRYEAQLSGSRRGIAVFEIDLQADLLLPRLKGPFNPENAKGNVPRTKYGISYRLYNQPDFYTQEAFGGHYGYEWLGGTEHFHDLKLVNFIYLRLLNTSDRLNQLLENNFFFRESFNNQVIVGPSYHYTYVQKSKRDRWVRYFFTGAIDFAGNALYAGNRLLDIPRESNGNENDEENYTFFGVPFSQFGRLQQDHRVYLTTSRSSELVLRANVGVGVSYENSNTLPFSKQFFVGGPSSLRAFQPRGLGPGTYRNTDTQFGSFFDQTGDIIIELNVEHRFAQTGFFEGAIFSDIGNVWLISENEERPGGKFEWKDFVSEMAIATGVGLRMDLTAVLIRLDLAFPIRLPYLAEGDRWAFDQISISRDWRRDNLIWNIGIGYPF